MKRISWILLFLLLILTACTGQDGAGLNCRESYCIDLSIEEPVIALEPALVTISVQTNQELPKLTVGMYLDLPVAFNQVVQMPENAALTIENDRYLYWQINSIQRDTYLFQASITFPEANIPGNVFYYVVRAKAASPTIGPITDSIIVYLDPEGNQVPETTAKVLLQTEYPVPTPRPDLTVIVPTPFPTPIWRTAEPGSPAYPPPEATLPPYP